MATLQQTTLHQIDRPEGRVYDTPVGIVPSVNTIISGTESPASKAKLQRWRDRQPSDQVNAASDRGTAVHALIETFLTTGSPAPDIPAELFPYWQSIDCWLRLAGPSASFTHEVYRGT